MQRRHILPLAIILGTVAASGLWLGRALLSAPPSSAPSARVRRSLRAVSAFVDPKSIEHKHTPVALPPGDDAWFADLKATRPSIYHYRPAAETRAVVVDVVSIGCEAKLAHMVAQAGTWASGARYFLGFTERDDFDGSCAAMGADALASYVRTCRAPRRGSRTFGVGHEKTTDAGWHCAQRRPGRALGWLRTLYGAAPPPDVLILVDDDTSVDIDKVKQAVLAADADLPFVGAGAVNYMGKYDSFLAPHGGFGTFFNKAAIVQMTTQPIFCDERRHDGAFANNACAKLDKNRAGEADFFRPGDSVFDVFYKHAAHPRFCMHSDWGIGYMVHNYAGARLEQVLPEGHRRRCKKESVSCHNQSPKDMKKFVRSHPQVKEIMQLKGVGKASLTERMP